MEFQEKSSLFSASFSEDFLKHIPYNTKKELVKMEWIKQMNEALAYIETQLY